MASRIASLDSDEAFSFIDGRLLALIFSMLVVGAALDHSGAAALIVLAKPFFSGIHEVFGLNFTLSREEIFDPAAALRRSWSDGD